MTYRPAERDVLLAVDVQYDFLPGGALAVAGGDAVIAPINAIARRFAHVVLTQDWHTPAHLSFASSHPGKAPYSTIELDYGTQILWPDHCVQGTHGAAIAAALDIPHVELIVRKGHRRAIDSYSAFVEADGRTRTGLAGYLRERGFTRVFLAGLATDFCVAYSAIDARDAGFDVVVLTDACRAIDADGSLARAEQRMREADVALASTSAVE